MSPLRRYVRNTTARAFSVVASALGIPALLPFLKAVCLSKKSWQARHTGIKIVQQIAILMGCAVLPHLKSMVDIIKHGLKDENQKVKTITALAVAGARQPRREPDRLGRGRTKLGVVATHPMRAPALQPWPRRPRRTASSRSTTCLSRCGAASARSGARCALALGSLWPAAPSALALTVIVASRASGAEWLSALAGARVLPQVHRPHHPAHGR